MGAEDEGSQPPPAPPPAAGDAAPAARAPPITPAQFLSWKQQKGKYIAELLQRANMTACRPVSTPMSTSEKLSKEFGTPLSALKATKY